jgi:hypothetical protein
MYYFTSRHSQGLGLESYGIQFTTHTTATPTGGCVPLLVWLVTVVTPPAQAVATGSRFCRLLAPRPLRLRAVAISL